MRKSFILLTICALAGLWSCQSRIEDETPITYASDESEVEITVAADRTPRNVPSATPDENIIDNLDILLFDSKVYMLAGDFQDKRKVADDSSRRQRLRCLFLGQLP